MLDVHAPHEKMHGYKDFFLHLFTITIGLLIALSLEGCVEWQHHRHLVHDAEAGLAGEIAHNMQTVSSLHQQIADEQKQLDDDIAVIERMEKPGASPEDMTLGFRQQTLDDTAWRTAQSTGALAYMPYADAKTYSDIYDLQDQLYKAEHEVEDQVLRAGAFPSTQGKDWLPTPAQAEELIDRIGLLRMRLLLLDSLVKGLNDAYRDFDTHHG